MYDYTAPGEIERKALLLPLNEVDVSDAEFDASFGPRCGAKELIKREAEGLIAVGIRHRLDASDETPVFITELTGDAQIGDVTWENFTVLIVECNGHKIEFDSYTEYSNFDAFMKWMDEPAGS